MIQRFFLKFGGLKQRVCSIYINVKLQCLFLKRNKEIYSTWIQITAVIQCPTIVGIETVLHHQKHCVSFSSSPVYLTVPNIRFIPLVFYSILPTKLKLYLMQSFYRKSEISKSLPNVNSYHYRGIKLLLPSLMFHRSILKQVVVTTEHANFA